MPIVSSSSLPSAEGRLIRVPLQCLQAHPANANVMGEEFIDKLARNIAHQGGEYPPLLVRPLPGTEDSYQILDGVHRKDALLRLGHLEALCFLWPCDDETALILLATVNRLQGQDVPAKRAELLAELTQLMSVEALALLLPEDADLIADTIALLDVDTERLLADLTAAAQAHESDSPRLISFAVTAEDEVAIEQVVGAVSAGLDGSNRRGRALGMIARAYAEGAGDA